MAIGFTLPQFGRMARDAAGIAGFATEAEKAGASSLWVADRILAPVNPSIGYPGAGGDFPPEFRSVHDPLALLALAAGVTSRVKLGSSTINATWYPPPLLARALTSIDQLSGGRLIAGFGIGWSPEEYQAVGVDWPRRGARLDELLDVLDALWAGGTAEYQGDFYTLPATRQDLVPAQRPRPPVHLGTFTEAGLRRIGQRADGWLPTWMVPERFPVERLVEGWATVRRFAEQAGRDPDSLTQVLRVNVVAGVPVETVADEVRAVTARLHPADAFVELNYLAGTTAEAIDVAGRLLELVDAG
ncbi:MAG TPA: TIGR03619 family F420-dependent LLM class oxidoreductase [Pseudonocardiaceae bacterium]|nr:TIGR03619 family F420-dependent LLM class oxidoreductase [Pseudonocardiaceae bacterium]